jgi:hypothetical protein
MKKLLLLLSLVCVTGYAASESDMFSAKSVCENMRDVPSVDDVLIEYPEKLLVYLDDNVMPVIISQ